MSTVIEHDSRVVRVVPWAARSIRWFYSPVIRAVRGGLVPDGTAVWKGEFYVLGWRGEAFQEVETGSWSAGLDPGFSFATSQRVAIEYPVGLPRAGSHAEFEWPSRDAVVFYRAFAVPFRKGRVEVVEHSTTFASKNVCFQPDSDVSKRVGYISIKDRQLEIRWRKSRRRSGSVVVVLHYDDGRTSDVFPLHTASSLEKSGSADHIVRLECFGRSGLIFSLDAADSMEIDLFRESKAEL